MGSRRVGRFLFRFTPLEIFGLDHLIRRWAETLLLLLFMMAAGSYCDFLFPIALEEALWLTVFDGDEEAVVG
jgi:hypothetical protein